jgi:hypothetical protein
MNAEEIIVPLTAVKVNCPLGHEKNGKQYALRVPGGAA